MSVLNLLFQSVAMFDNIYMSCFGFFAVLCKGLFKTICQKLIKITLMNSFFFFPFKFIRENILQLLSFVWKNIRGKETCEIVCML